MTAHQFRSTFVASLFLGLGSFANLIHAATLPVPTSASVTAHFDASDINGDGGVTDPGNNSDVNSWNELVGGTQLINNFPTDGKPTFLSSGIGGQRTVRFVSDGNGSNAGVGDLQADDLLFDNPANFNAQTVFVVATMNNGGGSYSAVVTDQFAGMNIRKDASGPNYYPGNSGDFVIQGVTGTFNINGNPRLDIPGGYGAAHVVKAVSNTVQNYNGVRISDNAAADRRWNGDVAEIIAYNGVLNGNDGARVNNYLIDKYGINQVVDERLANTSQIADASIAGAGGGVHVGVNFQYNNAAVTTSFKGINFDNVNLTSGVPLGPITLNTNAATAGATLTMSIPGYGGDATGRNLFTSVAGTDNATINGVLNDMFYVGGEHTSADLNFANLPANTSVFVQVLGGENGWFGTAAVTANGNPVGTWTTVANGGFNDAALFGFFATTNSAGQLNLDFSVASGNFFGISGIILTVPEPTSAVLFGCGVLGLVALRRRRRPATADSGNVLLLAGQRTVNRAVSMCIALFVLGVVSLGFVGQTQAVSFTDSNQLKLNNAIAAVNLYYSDNSQEPAAGTQMTSPLQGVSFDNLDVVANNNVAFPLSGGGSLTISLPHTGEARAQFVSSTIVGTGADEAPAEQFATDISYFAAGEAGSLSFAFGAGRANEPVRVQIIGGDEAWGGTLQASVNSVIKGIFSGDNNNTTAELLTFSSKTDPSGNLVIDLNQIAGNFVGIAGVVVALPEPTSATLLGCGIIGLLDLRRRQMRKVR